MANISESNTFIVKIRGIEFEIHSDIIKHHPNAKLCRILNDLSNVENRTSIANRDPTIFGCVIGFYTSGSLHMPHGSCATLVKEELDFWEISEHELCFACYKKLKDDLDDIAGVEHRARVWCEHVPASRATLNKASDDNAPSSSDHRELLWTFLEKPSSSKLSAVYTGFILFLNVLSVLLPTLMTMSAMRDPRPSVIDAKCTKQNRTCDPSVWTTPYLMFNSVHEYIRGTTAKPYLLYMDLIVLTLLSVDLILRFCASKSKLRFFKSPINIIGVISLLLPWLYRSLQIINHFVSVPFKVLTVMSKFLFVTVLRVVYVMRIANWYTPMRVILFALKESRRELFLLAVILILNSVLYGFLIYTVEIQGDTIWSVPEGIYWAVITMTTVGYGDIHPVGPWGKVIGCCCAMSGILLIALPVPVIANNFIKYYSVSKMSLDGRKPNS